jgi:MFS family permease
MMGLGWVLPPLFTAHIVERLHKVKRYTLLMGISQRIPYLAAGMILLLWKDIPPVASLCTVALAPLFSGFLGGVGATSFWELTSRIIPKDKMASVNSLRYIITVLLGIAAGFVVKDILSTHPGNTGYGILHLITFAFTAVSWFALAMVDEVHIPEKRAGGKTVDLVDNLSSVPAIIRNDSKFRNLIISTFFGYGYYVTIPFLAIHAMTVLGKDLSFTGVLLTAQMLGGITGNFIAGFIGDYFGCRRILIISRSMSILLFSLIPFANSESHFLGIFFFFGMVFFMDRVANMSYPLQIAPDARRPTYVSLVTVIMFPAALSASLLSSFINGTSHNIILSACVTVAAISISLFFVMKIRE